MLNKISKGGLGSFLALAYSSYVQIHFGVDWTTILGMVFSLLAVCGQVKRGDLHVGLIRKNGVEVADLSKMLIDGEQPSSVSDFMIKAQNIINSLNGQIQTKTMEANDLTEKLTIAQSSIDTMTAAASSVKVTSKKTATKKSTKTSTKKTK